jgi:flagellar biosynthesis/type III secretory pathway chaperone
MKVDNDKAAMACAELSESLWRVRDLLELLAYRVEVQRALVETGRATWIARSTREVDQLLQQIRTAELMRAIETAPAAQALMLSDDASLGEIAAAAPAPWDHVIAEHRHALLEATSDLTQAALANRDLRANGARAVEDVLAQFSGPHTSSTYSAAGTPEHDPTRRLFDQSS